MRYIGVALTIVMLAGFFAARGKLNRIGLEFFAWNETPSSKIVRAIGLGAIAVLLAGWLFRDMRTGTIPPWPEVWIGITFGPLAEELVFRGCLFYGIASALKRWLARPGWLVVFVVAALFAVSHLARVGITPSQIGTIFLTGSLFGWLRLDSGSTVPPFCAHMTYNACLYAIAVLRVNGGVSTKTLHLHAGLPLASLA
jgi:membrane protease YdiL (CAAX protease family)